MRLFDLPDTMLLRHLLLVMALVFPVMADAYRPGEPPDFSKNLVQAALERTRHEVIYDGSYFSIAYPNGDVPDDVGVCTDVIIRSYRQLGIDLQADVHEEMLLLRVAQELL